MAGRSRKKTQVSETTEVVTAPEVKTVTWQQIFDVAKLKYIKGDAHAEYRRKIADARNLAGIYTALKAAKDDNNVALFERRKTSAIAMVNDFQLRYGVKIVAQQ